MKQIQSLRGGRPRTTCSGLRGLWFSLLLLFCGVSIAGAQQKEQDKSDVQPAPGAEFVEGQLLVKLRPGVTPGDLAGTYRAAGFASNRRISRTLNIWLVDFDESLRSVRDMQAELAANSRVLIVQPNHYVTQRFIPNDTRFPDQWGLHNIGQGGGTVDADIDAVEAWDITRNVTTCDGDDIVVAVVDNGFQIAHPDMNYWTNPGEIAGNGIDDDGNGYIDDVNGWNGVSNTGFIPTADHGTHVAGIVGATGNNNLGVSGVAPGVSVMAVIAYDNSPIVEAEILAAYDYVLDARVLYNQSNGASGAFVVATNSSFGVDRGDPSSYPLWCDFYNTMGEAGILSAGATANIHLNVETEGDVPTACTSDFLIAVTNTTRTDQKFGSAAFGNVSIDLGAPGTQIWSTLPFGTYGDETGTSMATPHVAGTVALMYAAAPRCLIELGKENPELVAVEMRQMLLDGVDPIPALAGITTTGGRLNARNALDNVGDFIEFNLLIPSQTITDDRHVFLARNNITHSSPLTITPGGSPDVVMRAGNQITLSPSFQAANGSDFHAYIDPCFDVSCTGVSHSKRAHIAWDASISDALADNSGAKPNIAEHYPNPFSDKVTIDYYVAEDSPVSLWVNDVYGRPVANLLQTNSHPEGRYSVDFKAEGLANGVYFYTLQVGTQHVTRKLVLMR